MKIAMVTMLSIFSLFLVGSANSAEDFYCTPTPNTVTVSKNDYVSTDSNAFKSIRESLIVTVAPKVAMKNVSITMKIYRYDLLDTLYYKATTSVADFKDPVQFKWNFIGSDNTVVPNGRYVAIIDGYWESSAGIGTLCGRVFFGIDIN